MNFCSTYVNITQLDKIHYSALKDSDNGILQQTWLMFCTLPILSSFIPQSINQSQWLINKMSNSMEQNAFEKLTFPELLKNFQALYVTQKFIIVFTTARTFSPSSACWIQSTPSHPISLRSVLILSFHLCLGFQSGLIPSGYFTQKPVRIFLLHIRATCPVHLILLD
jgi:hypothetical protein